MPRTLTLELPPGVDLSEQEVRLTLAAHLYADGKLSLGYAADLALMDKVAFIEALGKHQVSIFNSPVEEVIREMRNA